MNTYIIHTEHLEDLEERLAQHEIELTSLPSIQRVLIRSEYAYDTLKELCEPYELLTPKHYIHDDSLTDTNTDYSSAQK